MWPDEPWKHYAKENKPNTQKMIILWFHLGETLRISKFIERRSRIEVWRKSGSSGNEEQWWLYNILNVLNATAYLKSGNFYVIHSFYNFL